jgi:hypothetical protein
VPYPDIITLSDAYLLQAKFDVVKLDPWLNPVI